MPDKNYDLLKEPLFICYATVLQIWYEDPEIKNTVSENIGQWLNDFCDKLEIDKTAHAAFLRQSQANLVRVMWYAFLQDLQIMPSTGSFDIIKSSLDAGLRQQQQFKPGAIKKDDDPEPPEPVPV